MALVFDQGRNNNGVIGKDNLVLSLGERVPSIGRSTVTRSRWLPQQGALERRTEWEAEGPHAEQADHHRTISETQLIANSRFLRVKMKA